MKKEYNYLDELTDKSNKYKVKVKVIEKARPHQCPGKKKIQKLMLQDDKAINTLQEEKHWIRVTIPNVTAEDLYVYIGCSICGRKGDANSGELYKCDKCNQDDTNGVPRGALKVDAFNSISTRQFTLFSKDIESMFKMTMDELYCLYTAEDKSLLYDPIDQIRMTEYLFQIGPTIALNHSNLMARAVKKIKMA